MKLVLVTWEDASQEPGTWVDVDTTEPMVPIIFEQVGFLVCQTPTEIVLTQALQTGGKGLMAARQRIPAGMVRSIAPLGPLVATHTPPRKPRKEINGQGH